MQILQFALLLTLQMKISKCWEESPYTLFQESFTSSSFETFEGWSVSNGLQTVTDCGQYRLIGGLGQFAGTTIEKTFNVPAIYELMITTTVLLIDSWDDEYFKIFVDDVEQYSIQSSQTGGDKICGSFPCGNQDCVTKITEIEIILLQSFVGNVKITMRDYLDEDPWNESWGMRDFKLWGKLCPSQCGTCENYPV